MYEGPPYMIPFQVVEESATSGCSWCSFVLSAARQKISPVPLQDEYLTVSFSSFNSRDKSTPVGNNRANALVNGQPLFGTIFVEEDSVVANTVTAREIQSQISSERASHQILEWLVDCDGHASCPSMEPLTLPTRVIDVSPVEHPDVPKLVETKGAPGYYVALSYCWGLDQVGLTTTSNLETREQRLDLSDLSQSSRDAITVTRNLGIKYLWIDAICILQDSADDKVIELASMCRIYQQATVTIVAASATSASQGFLEDRKPPAPALQIPFWAPDDSLTTVYLRPEELYNDEKEPINSRAWTLQEQLLSPRLLIYATHTLQYQCREQTVNLGNSIHAPTQLESRRYLGVLDHISEETRDQAVGRVWVDIIRMYSQRQLSFQEDKLTALAGVAEAFSSHGAGNYVAGLWSGEALARLLLWVAKSKEPSTSSTYIAPSWSWASLDCPVFYHHFHHMHTFNLYRVRITRCDMTLDNDALPFGRVRSGELELEGCTRSGHFEAPQSFRWSSMSITGDTSVNQEMTALLSDPDAQKMDLKCLAIARRTYEGRNMRFTPVIDGLLLSNISNSTGYRRVGSFHGLYESNFHGFTRETLRVV